MRRVCAYTFYCLYVGVFFVLGGSIIGTFVKDFFCGFRVHVLVF